MGVMLYYFFLDGYSLPPIPLCPQGLTPRCRKLLTTPGRAKDLLVIRAVSSTLASGKTLPNASVYLSETSSNLLSGTEPSKEVI